MICTRAKVCGRAECRRCAGELLISDVVAACPDGLTQEQVAAILGVTQERISQIETAALAKLKGRMGGKGA